MLFFYSLLSLFLFALKWKPMSQLECGTIEQVEVVGMEKQSKPALGSGSFSKRL